MIVLSEVFLHLLLDELLDRDAVALYGQLQPGVEAVIQSGLDSVGLASSGLWRGFAGLRGEPREERFHCVGAKLDTVFVAVFALALDDLVVLGIDCLNDFDHVPGSNTG